MTTTEPTPATTEQAEPGADVYAPDPAPTEAGTELEPVRSAPLTRIAAPGRAEWDLLLEQAEQLSRSNLVPVAYRGKPGELLACSLMARELGRGLMWGLRHLWVSPDGKIGQSAEGMVGLIISAGYELWPVEVNREHAVAGWRRDGREGTMEYHIDEAVAAGLVSIEDGKPHARSDKGKPLAWEKFTGDMLWARVASRTGRRIFPDILAGAAYVPEELGARVNPETGEVDATGYKTITVEEARTLRSRAHDLSDGGKDRFREGLRDLGVVLYRGRDTEAHPLEPILAASQLDAVEELLKAIEADEPKAPAPPKPSDDEPAEGEIVGHDDPPAADTEHVAEAEVVEGSPSPATEGETGQAAGPFNGDSGYCDKCGGPVWYAASESDGGPGWLHCDEDDAALAHEGPVTPAAAGVDVDGLYAAAHPRPPETPDVLEQRTNVAVKAMTPTAVLRELTEAGLSTNGPPAQCAARLVEHRLTVAARESQR